MRGVEGFDGGVGDVTDDAVPVACRGETEGTIGLHRHGADILAGRTGSRIGEAEGIADLADELRGADRIVGHGYRRAATDAELGDLEGFSLAVGRVVVGQDIARGDRVFRGGDDVVLGRERVVRTDDVERHRIGVAAALPVADSEREDLGRVTLERIDRGGVDRVGVVAVSINTQRTIGTLEGRDLGRVGRVDDLVGVGIARVRVGDGDITGNIGVSIRRIRIRDGVNRSNHRRNGNSVVRTGDGDGEGLLGRVDRAVVRRVLDEDVKALRRVEAFIGRVRRVERPAAVRVERQARDRTVRQRIGGRFHVHVRGRHAAADLHVALGRRLVGVERRHRRVVRAGHRDREALVGRVHRAVVGLVGYNDIEALRHVEALVGRVARVERPAAVRVERQARDRGADEGVGRGLDVHVGRRDAATDRGVVFGDGLRRRERRHRRVVRAGHRDREGLLGRVDRAVVRRVLDEDVKALRRVEAFIGRVRRVERPAAVRVERQARDRTVRQRIGGRFHVHVRGRHAAADLHVALGRRLVGVERRHRRVVRAGHRDREALVGRVHALVVGHLVGDNDVAGLAGIEVLVSRIAWIEAPAAVTQERETSDGGYLGIGSSHTEHVGVRRGQLARDGGSVFSGRLRSDEGRDRSVVRAGDSDRDVAGRGCRTVGRGNGVSENQRFADREVVEGVDVRVKGPGEGLRAVGAQQASVSDGEECFEVGIEQSVGGTGAGSEFKRGRYRGGQVDVRQGEITGDNSITCIRLQNSTGSRPRTDRNRGVIVDR